MSGDARDTGTNTASEGAAAGNEGIGPNRPDDGGFDPAAGNQGITETSGSAAGAEESPPGQQVSAPNTAQQGGSHVTAGDPEGAGKSPETTAVKRDPVEAIDSADEAGSRPDTEHDPRTPEQIEAARIIGPMPERLRRTG